MKRIKSRKIKKCRGFYRIWRKVNRLESLLSNRLGHYIVNDLGIDSYDASDHELFKSIDELNKFILTGLINSKLKIKSIPKLKFHDNAYVKYYFTELYDKNNDRLKIDIADNKLILTDYDNWKTDYRFITEGIC